MATSQNKDDRGFIRRFFSREPRVSKDLQAAVNNLNASQDVYITALNKLAGTIEKEPDKCTPTTS